MQEDQNGELMDQEGTDAFAAGFDDEPGQAAGQPEQESEQVAVEDTPPGPEEPSAGQAAPQPEEPPLSAQPAAPAAPVPQPHEEPQPPKTVEIPEAIRAEFAELEQLSPEAAAIAREDSPEGDTLRRRLAEYGADNAMDRAELFMARREREAVAAERQAGMVEAANRHFVTVVRQAHPDLFEASRSKADNERFQADMRAWIEHKPYAEAAPLMDVFLHGRDPHAVAELITRFKNERQTPQMARTNPDGAFAVPRRGAPGVPQGVGSKDDFDAGWNI